MNNDDDQKLDALLRGWAAERVDDRPGLDELTARICADLRAQSTPVSVLKEPQGSGGGRRALWWGLLAASIALLVYAGFHFKVTTQSGGVDSSAELARIPQQALREKALVADELRTVFPGQFAWSMETGQTTKLGFRSDDNGGDAERMVVVRFVLMSRTDADHEWSVLQTIDFLTRSDEMVELGPAADQLADHAPQGVLWAHALADGMISVDAELEIAAPSPVRMTSSQIQTPGSATEIWRASQGSVEYRMYQSAELLDGGKVG